MLPVCQAQFQAISLPWSHVNSYLIGTITIAIVLLRKLQTEWLSYLPFSHTASQYKLELEFEPRQSELKKYI